MNFSELKRSAKENLKGKYGESIKLFLICFLICIVISITITVITNIFKNNEIINVFLSFISPCIVYGFYAGFYSFFLKISRNEEVSCTELFKHNNLFFVTIGASLVVGIFSFLGLLFLIIPGFIIALNYSMIYFVIVDYPELGVMDILAKSKEIIKGHRIDYMVLNLSFLGWYILSYFTLGILLLWLAPYIMVTTANFYNEISK